MKKIEIKCKGTKYIDINELLEFQGNLKELSKENFEKLKKSILKYGFRIPVFVWRNYILDGHQRLFVVKRLLESGYTIDKIPVVEIQAKDKKEAKKILLLINSRYGKITDDGLYEFIETSNIKVDEIINKVDLPEIDFNFFVNSFYNNDEIELIDINKLQIQYSVIIKCSSKQEQEKIMKLLNLPKPSIKYRTFIEIFEKQEKDKGNG